MNITHSIFECKIRDERKKERPTQNTMRHFVALNRLRLHPNGKNMFKISTHCQTNSNLFPHLTSMDPGIREKEKMKKKQPNHDCENKDRNERKTGKKKNGEPRRTQPNRLK